MKGRKPKLVRSNDSLNSVPAAPKWMAPEARDEWRRIAPQLVGAGIITPADLASLENLCVAQGRVRQIEKLLAAGFDKDLVRASNQALTIAKQIAAEMGCTPIARSRAAMNATQADDGVADALGL